jgi:hypothetical protein
MSIDRAGNMTVAILLLIAGCVMTAKFHAFGVLRLIATHKFLDAAAPCCRAPHTQRDPAACRSPKISIRSVSSARTVNEACGEAVALRQRGGILTASMPPSTSTASNAAVS